MKNFLVFEQSIYVRPLEKDFYYFCLKRQIILLKYLFINLSAQYLYFFGFISPKKYYEMRWSFLKDVKSLYNKVNSYWKPCFGKLSKKASFISSSTEYTILISIYPEVLLSKISGRLGLDLKANTFDIKSGKFNVFENVYQIYKKAAPHQRHNFYGYFNKDMSTDANVDLTIVYYGKNFKRLAFYRIYRILTSVYTGLVLLVLGGSVGFVSLYYASGYYMEPMFLSYFRVANLPLLNIFPVIFCIYFIYFLSNRVWLSFLMTAFLTMALTWINYFKLLFRNDPLVFEDLNLFFESMNMAGKYNIRLDWRFICVIISCIFCTIIARFLVNIRIRSPQLRFSGVILMIFIGYFSYKFIYLNNSLYTSTQNTGMINKWSATQVFISKGFIYPFIHSAKASNYRAPVGYQEETAKASLYSYDYSDIPPVKKVNIISIMLEAYNDFSKFKQIEFNIDIYKYLHQLEAESYSGELVTNIFAGGTVSTERCFLTGFTALPNFRSNVNSYVRYFDEQGYTVEGSHPSYSWFYNRRNVNEYLGFKKYYYFENYYSKLTDGKIAKDDILFSQIINLYNLNKRNGKPYFSFNVTYQNHGPYPSDKKPPVKFVKNKGYNEAEYNILNNYFFGIYSTTQQLKNLIDYFREEKEPVVVILFGDHNPWLGDNNSVYNMLGIDFDMGSQKGFYDYYCTPYIIWGNPSAREILINNFNGKGPRIGPYFLMHEFFKLAGYKGNEYMKISNTIKDVIDVIHVKRQFKENDLLTSRLSPQSEQKLADFLKVQYYWISNFRDRKT